MARQLLPWDFALILLALGVIVPWRSTVRVRALLRAPSISSKDRLALYASTIAFQWLAAAIVLWRAFARGYQAADLALKMPRPLLVAAASLALSSLLGASQFFGLRRLSTQPEERHAFLRNFTRKVLPQNDVERLVFIALVASVALCEEVLYRGFVQRLFQNLTNSVLLGLVSSAALFSLAHIYQGRRGLYSTFAIGVGFSAVRVWTLSLAPGIAAHFVADVIPGLLFPRWPNTAVPSSSQGPTAIAEQTLSPCQITRPKLTK